MSFYNSAESEILIIRRRGDTSSPFIPIEQTIRLTASGSVILNEIPDISQGVQVEDSLGNSLSATQSKTPAVGNFYVDYLTGRITHNPNDVGKDFTYSYFGTGSAMISDKRIFLSTDDNGNVTQTLSGLVEDVNERVTVLNQVDAVQFHDRQDQFDVQLAEKATKTEVDTKVAQIVSGSPKGTYETLSALQTAKPTGDTGVFVVTDDGKWYFWNGSTWIEGGVYQATQIAENSVTSDMISSLDVNKINYNFVTNPFFDKVSKPAGYATYFEALDGGGTLSNIATSANLYIFSGETLELPEEYEFKYTATVDIANGNGQMHGFTGDGGVNRFLFGYEPAHSAFELYTNTSGFKVLDPNTNFSSGEYQFTLKKTSDATTVQIIGSGYNKTFVVTDYLPFDDNLYSAVRFQLKIPALGSVLKNISLLEKTTFSKEGLKTFSDRGATSGRNVHIYQFGGQGNDWCFVRTPDNYNPNGKPHPFVIANHGNGWVMDGTPQKANWTKRTMYVESTDSDYIANPEQYNLVPAGNPEYLYSNPTIEALLAAGYVVCGAQNYADNLYGNNDNRNAMQDFYFHMIKNFNVEEKCYMIGASNGAMTSLNGMYLLNGIERVKAMILQYPLTCLWRQYTNYSAHQAGIEAAYGISPGLTEEQFEKATRTHDPEKVNTVVIGTDRIKTTALPPIKFYYSFGDTVTHPNNNSLPLMQVLEDSNFIVEDVEATGGHGDYTHFNPQDYLDFFERYR